MKKKLLIIIGFSVFAFSNFSRDDSSEIVTDNITKLMWQDNNNTYYSKDYHPSKKWKDAIDYCENLTLGGYSDWRLPNINELKTIVDYNTNRSKIFKYIENTEYWSSTTMLGYTSGAWIVDFKDGITKGHGKGLFNIVRCVRGGK